MHAVVRAGLGALLAGVLLAALPSIAQARRLVGFPPRVAVVTGPVAAPCVGCAPGFVPYGAAVVPYGYPYPYAYPYPYPYGYAAGSGFAPGFLPGADWRDTWQDVGRTKVYGFTLR